MGICKINLERLQPWGICVDFASYVSYYTNPIFNNVHYMFVCICTFCSFSIDPPVSDTDDIVPICVDDQTFPIPEDATCFTTGSLGCTEHGVPKRQGSYWISRSISKVKVTDQSSPGQQMVCNEILSSNYEEASSPLHTVQVTINWGSWFHCPTVKQKLCHTFTQYIFIVHMNPCHASGISPV